MADGSVTIFGSEMMNGATAAVTRVYVNGKSKAFVVQPAHESAWFYDAVAIGRAGDFLAVRQINDGRGALDWLSLK